jgi:hypothetical protein
MNLFRLKDGNSTNHKFNERALLLVALVLACFALSPRAQAREKPDGDLGNNNTAEGTGALFSLTTGSDNTASGSDALFSLTTGSFNTATGSQALFSNTIGAENTANGWKALFSNASGAANTADGALALHNNTIGDENIAIGFAALLENTSGEGNTAVGFQALGNNRTGVQNTANGLDALSGNTTGNNNTATGFAALSGNRGGENNTANGVGALDNNSTGRGNIALGFNAGINVSTADNVICIGNVAQNVSNSCYIGQIFGATSSEGTAVFINSDGKLGTSTSSARFKDEIKPMDKASDVILALRPVTFRYKREIDPNTIPQFGLVAEEVEKVNSDLLVHGRDGKPYTVRYEAVNAMLLNKFLKEHRTVQGQQKEIDALKAELKEQKALIQKVSAQIEVTKPAPSVVNNDQ